MRCSICDSEIDLSLYNLSYLTEEERQEEALKETGLCLRCAADAGERWERESLGKPWNERQYIVTVRCSGTMTAYRFLTEADSLEDAAELATMDASDECWEAGHTHACEDAHQRGKLEPYFTP